MTALSDWNAVGKAGTDAELVRASLTGDQQAFGQMYDRYADRLHDFCVGMLGDRDGAADCVQDVFCRAATCLAQLRDPERLRPWLYSIARNEALRRLRDRRRETPSDELPETATGEAGPETLAARTELADLITDAAGGLSDRDRSVLELAFRHGLDGPELAEALGVTPTSANTIMHRLRETVERSLGALLVARRARSAGGCAELAAILKGWDGHFNVLMRKRISRHIESCNICDDERRRLVSPTALLGAAPVFIPAPAWLRDSTLREVQLGGPSVTTESEIDAASHADDATTPSVDDAGGGRRSRNGLFLAVLLLAVLGAAGGLTYIGLHQQAVPIAPAEKTEPLPAPTPAPTGSKTPSVLPVQTAPSTTPSVAAPASASTPTPTPTPTDAPSPPAEPPVDTRPPLVYEPVPEDVPFDPPAGDPSEPESETDPPSRRGGSSTDPTTERPNNGIAGIPPPGSQPTRRAINPAPPGSNNGGGRTSAGDSDGGDSDSPRRRSVS